MKSSLPKTILTIVLIIAVSAVITTISFTAFYFYITRETTTTPEEQQPLPVTVILEFPLATVTTNLADDHYVQVNIVLQYPELKQRVWFGLREVVDDTLPKLLESNLNQISDVINMVLRTQTSASLKGANIERVKLEMVSQINKILQSSRYGISNVLFVSIVVT